MTRNHPTRYDVMSEAHALGRYWKTIEMAQDKIDKLATDYFYQRYFESKVLDELEEMIQRRFNHV